MDGMLLPAAISAETLYMVTRSDDNGHTFIIEEGLTERAADELHSAMLRGHKQCYNILPYFPHERAHIIETYQIIE